MSRPPGSHWRAEDYVWDAHKMQAQVQKVREKEVSEGEAQQPPVAQSAGSTESQEAEDSKSRHTASEPALSEDPGPRAELSGEQSGGNSEGAAASGEATAAVSAVPVVRDTLAAVHGPSKKRIPLQCQVDGCQKDLSKEKEYYQRYRICEDHLKLSSLMKDGIQQRFCQQCGRFHVLTDFDADKRSCRSRLNLHNNRRRKRIPEQATPRQDLGNLQPRTRRTRTRRRRMPYGEEAAPEDIEALDVQEAAVQDQGYGEAGVQGQGRHVLQDLEARNEDLGDEEYQAGPGVDRRVTLRTPQTVFNNPFRAYPISISTATLQGLGMLPLHIAPMASQGALQDISELYPAAAFARQRQFSDPAGGIQPEQHLREARSPRPSPAEMHAWISRQQIQQEQEAAEQAAEQAVEGSRLRQGSELEEAAQAGGRLYKCASDPVYGTVDHQAQLANVPWGLLTAPELSRGGPPATAGGDESSLSTRSQFQLQSSLAQDFWYQQQAQLLRGASWGSVDDISPHHRGVQGGQMPQDFDFLRYSVGGHSGASEATYIVGGMPPGKQHHQRSPPTSPIVGQRPGTRNKMPLGMLDPRHPSAEPSSMSILGRHLSDRHSTLHQGLSGASTLSAQDSSVAQHITVSEAAASLQRIGSGSTRLERMPSGGHRLQQLPNASSPSLQSYESIYPQQSRSKEEAAHVGGGYSYTAPSGWAQHYQAFQEPEGPQGGEQYGNVEVGRAATKIHDLLPEGLPQHMRDDYLRLLGGDTAHLEAALRPGCTHLAATVVGQVHSRNALEAALDLLECGAPWTSGRVLIQLPSSAALLRDGAVTHFWNEQDLQQLLPSKPLTSTPAMVAGGRLAVLLPQGVAGPATRLLARCNGSFWVDRKLEGAAQEMELEIAQAAGEGVLWVEAEQEGLLSEPATVLLSNSQDVVEEVQRFLASVAGPQWGLQQSEGLLVDAGMVLQYAAFLGSSSPSAPAAPTAGTDCQGGSAGVGSRLGMPGSTGASASCCQATLPQDADPAAPGPMSDGAYVAYVTNAARHIFVLCCCEGMPALASKVLAVAAVGAEDFSSLVVSMEKLLRSGTLLQAAVLSTSLSMTIMLLDLYVRFGLAYNLAAEPGTTTILHVAAGLRDGGKMAKLLRDRCPGAASLWNSARDAAGLAPADVAYMLAKEQAGKGSSLQEDIRKLTHQTSLLNSPPATPRVPSLPLSPRNTARSKGLASGGRADNSLDTDVRDTCAGPQPLPDHWPRLSPRRYPGGQKAALQTQRVPDAEIPSRAVVPQGAPPQTQTFPTPRRASDGGDPLRSGRARSVQSPFASAVPMAEDEDSSPRFNPLLTVRHSWPSELEQLPHVTLTSRPECTAISDPEDGSKLHTWPVTKVELSTLGGMKGSLRAGDSASPMVIDVSASAVGSPSEEDAL